MTPTSGEADGIRLIRSTSLIARALTSSGMPAASTLSRSSLISACCGSSSPSSRWIALSCSRRMYSRWVLSISDLTSYWILPLSSRISIWRARNADTSFSRSIDVDGLEQLLALLGRHVGAVGHHVGEQAGLGDVAGGDGGLRRHGRAVGDVLLDLRLDAADQGLDLDARGDVVGQLLDRGLEVRRGAREPADADAALALDDGPDGAVLELHHLGDLGERADLVELGGIGDVLLLGLSLGDERDGPAVLDRGIECRDALLAADLERDDHLREDDRLPEGDEGQLTRRGRLLLLRVRRSLGHQDLLGCRSVGRRAACVFGVVVVIWVVRGPAARPFGPPRA